MTITKSELKEVYRREEDAKVKERLLLILRVEVDDVIPASAAKELHRSRPWASYRLRRFSKHYPNGCDGGAVPFAMVHSLGGSPRCPSIG